MATRWRLHLQEGRCYRMLEKNLNQKPPEFDSDSILVTGGTGSFGHFIIRELLQSKVKKITVFSRDEEKQLDMKREFKDENRLDYVIGDVRDYENLEECFERSQYKYVFHAAALKVITTIEENPLEGIKTNLQGTLNVKRICNRFGVHKAILISTDKAVKPVNAYGMTKGLAEKLWISDPQKTIFNVVRYGNVIGSRGSVVPFFRMLVQKNKPLTITIPEMTRFLLTLKQAISLVFKALDDEKGRKIFIPKIPAASIMVLADAIAGKDYPKTIIGIRAGEKIHETLISEEETWRMEDLGDLYVIHPYSSRFSFQNKVQKSEFRSDNTRQLTIGETKELLRDAEACY